MLQPNNVNKSPSSKPPAVLLQSRNHHFPEMPKFSFNNEKDTNQGRDAGLGSFTNASTSSLAMMKNLGLPGNASPMGSGSPRLGGGSSPMLPPANIGAGGGMAFGGFQASAAAGLAGMKGLGIPDLPGSGASGGGDVTLAKGTKRLGMGRPQPWGAKKARMD